MCQRQKRSHVELTYRTHCFQRKERRCAFKVISGVRLEQRRLAATLSLFGDRIGLVRHTSFGVVSDQQYCAHDTNLFVEAMRLTAHIARHSFLIFNILVVVGLHYVTKL